MSTALTVSTPVVAAGLIGAGACVGLAVGMAVAVGAAADVAVGATVGGSDVAVSAGGGWVAVASGVAVAVSGDGVRAGISLIGGWLGRFFRGRGSAVLGSDLGEGEGGATEEECDDRERVDEEQEAMASAGRHRA